MIGFRAWYTGGRVFRGASFADWLELPPQGCLAVVVYRATGRTRYDGADWIVFDGSTWSYVPSGAWGTWAPRPAIACHSCVKQGAPLETTAWARVDAAIAAAVDW